MTAKSTQFELNLLRTNQLAFKKERQQLLNKIKALEFELEQLKSKPVKADKKELNK
jgi:hypothetical protein